MLKQLCGLVVAVALVPSLGAQTRAPQNESIRQSDLRADLFFLAGDSLRGRLTDTEENRATADFIRSRFERMGLKPAGPNNSYFQPYNLMTATLPASPASNLLEVMTGDGSTRQLRAGLEFYPHRFSASGVASAPVLFASDIHNHPGAANFEAAARNYWPDTPPRILSYTLAAWADRIRIPVAQVSPAVAASLVAGTNKTLEELSKASETSRGFTPLALPGARVSVHASVDRHIVPDRNVVALIEGGDPRLKNEW